MKTKATILLGALLSAGSLLAQAPSPNQAPAAGATQSAQAQPAQTQPERDPAKQAKHLGKQLGLSSDQVTQITPILADRQEQMQNLRADSSLEPRERRAKAKQILQDSTAKVEAILNDTQKQQYEQMIADRRSRHNHRPQA